MKRMFQLALVLVSAGCGSSNPAGPPPPAPPPPPPPAPAADIAFVLTGGGESDIWVAQADGSNQRLLTNASIFDSQPRFDATGTVVYFVRFTALDGDIWRINADGSNQTRVTNFAGVGMVDFHPTAGVITRVGDMGIWTTDLAGSPEFQVTSPTGGVIDRAPGWSPDGTEIAFVRQNSPTDQELWVVSADGSNARMLATSNNAIGGLDWHPDGTRLAAVLYPGTAGLDWNVFDVPTDGAASTQLTTSGAAWAPRWSPDGTKITFRDGAANTDWFVAVANADGSGQISLPSGQRPIWSRDGTKIGFCQLTAGVDSGLAVVDSDGSNEVVIDGSATCLAGGFSWAR